MGVLHMGREGFDPPPRSRDMPALKKVQLLSGGSRGLSRLDFPIWPLSAAPIGLIGVHGAWSSVY